MGNGDVNITVLDNGGSQVQVPLSSVQAVIGWSGLVPGASPATPPPYGIIATSSPVSLQSSAGYGPGVEEAALACVQGAVVLYCPVPLTVKGSASAVVKTGSVGASAMTVVLDSTNGAYDDYLVKVIPVVAGTIGTGPCAIQVSLDNGRNYGPPINLGTQTTYVIPNTGITLSFTSATIGVGDVYTFGTSGPNISVGSIQTAIQTLVNSQYGVVGWGSMAIVGNVGSAGTAGVPTGCKGADAQTIEGYLDTAATVSGGQVFTRSFLSARDASPPSTFGGTGESESAWINSVNADYSNVSAKRLCVGAGNWNMPSAYSNAGAGTPAYRRNIAWAAAAKETTVPPQRHIGRVSDGSMPQISIFSQDASDGFIYHNEAVNGGLDYKTTGTGGRFMTTRLRRKKPGVFITNPLLMAPFGSQFWMLPYGLIIDEVCDIMTQVGDQFINDDIRLNPNGTMFATDAANLNAISEGAINSQMLANNEISPGTIVVWDQTNNIGLTGVANWSATVVARGYILTENGTVGIANSSAAGG